MTDTDKSINKALSTLRKSVAEHELNAVVQLPLWPEPKRGAPNSFIRSALFAAIQSKDRQFLKETVLSSQDGIVVKYTGEQLNQADLDVWETIVLLAREQPLTGLYGCLPGRKRNSCCVVKKSAASLYSALIAWFVWSPWTRPLALMHIR